MTLGCFAPFGVSKFNVDGAARGKLRGGRYWRCAEGLQRSCAPYVL